LSQPVVRSAAPAPRAAQLAPAAPVKESAPVKVDNGPVILSKGGMEITEAAKSGDGTVINVGIKTTGAFQCPDCRQKFDSEKAKQLHWKFIHDPSRHQED